MISRRVRMFVALLVLAACGPLDREDEVRAQIKTWVFLAQTRHFTSRPTCTAAIFETVSGDLRSTGPVRRATDLRAGQRALAAGQAVAFEVPGLSPNTVSEGLMSLSLPGGLGLVSSFTGPARACMTESFRNDIYLALMSQETVLIYDPDSNAVLLLHRPSQIAFFLRGNV